jgi:TRAP-type mannitol/chloroaromatic compound transport system permease large subunit
LASFVLFILIEAWLVRFVFNAADGHICRALFTAFRAAAGFFDRRTSWCSSCMFIDFFEIAFIVIPLLAPAAEKSRQAWFRA